MKHMNNIRKFVVLCIALAITIGSLSLSSVINLSHAEESAPEPVIIEQEAAPAPVEEHVAEETHHEIPEEPIEELPEEPAEEMSEDVPAQDVPAQEDAAPDAEAPQPEAEDVLPEAEVEAEPQPVAVEPSAEVFVEGYATVARGTDLLADKDSDEVIGAFKADAHVYAQLVSAEASEDQDWFKVYFDTEDARENGDDAFAGYVQRKALTPLTEEQTKELLEAAEEDRDIRTRKDVYLIPADSFELEQKATEAVEPVEEPAQETASESDPEAAPEVAARSAATAVDKVNVRKEATTKSEAVCQIAEKGTPVSILETVDLGTESWYRVIYNEAEGYIRSDLIEIMYAAESELPDAADEGISGEQGGYEHTFGDFIYAHRAEGTQIAILKYAGSDSDVTVPEAIESLPVTEIGEGAFMGNDAIQSLNLPDTIEIIGKKAFANCVNLKEWN